MMGRTKVLKKRKGSGEKKAKEKTQDDADPMEIEGGEIFDAIILEAKTEAANPTPTPTPNPNGNNNLQSHPEDKCKPSDAKVGIKRKRNEGEKEDPSLAREKKTPRVDEPVKCPYCNEDQGTFENLMPHMRSNHKLTETLYKDRVSDRTRSRKEVMKGPEEPKDQTVDKVSEKATAAADGPIKSQERSKVQSSNTVSDKVNDNAKAPSFSMHNSNDKSKIESSITKSKEKSISSSTNNAPQGKENEKGANEKDTKSTEAPTQVNKSVFSGVLNPPTVPPEKPVPHTDLNNNELAIIKSKGVPTLGDSDLICSECGLFLITQERYENHMKAIHPNVTWSPSAAPTQKSNTQPLLASIFPQPAPKPPLSAHQPLFPAIPQKDRNPFPPLPPSPWSTNPKAIPFPNFGMITPRGFISGNIPPMTTSNRIHPIPPPPPTNPIKVTDRNGKSVLLNPLPPPTLLPANSVFGAPVKPQIGALKSNLPVNSSTPIFKFMPSTPPPKASIQPPAAGAKPVPSPNLPKSTLPPPPPLSNFVSTLPTPQSVATNTPSAHIVQTEEAVSGTSTEPLRGEPFEGNANQSAKAAGSAVQPNGGNPQTKPIEVSSDSSEKAVDDKTLVVEKKEVAIKKDRKRGDKDTGEVFSSDLEDDFYV